MQDMSSIPEAILQELKALNDSFAIIHFNPDGIITKVNERFLNLFLYDDDDDVIGKNHNIFLPKKLVDSGEFEKFWQEILKKDIQILDVKGMKKNGEVMVVKATYIPVKDADGNVVQVLVSMTDKTKIIRDELSWKSQLEAIQSSQAIAEFALNGKLIAANERFLKILRYTPEEIKGKHHSVFCEELFANSPDYNIFWDEIKNGVTNTGQFKRVTKYGKIIWLQATYTPIFGVSGEVIKIIKFAQDITQDKERSLYYEGQIEAISKSQAVIEFNSEGIVLDANEMFLSTVGYTLDEVVGKPHSIFCEESYANSNAHKLFWEELKAGEHHTGVFKRISKSGFVVWIQASYNPIFGVDGKVSKIIKYAHNITQEKELSLYNQGQLDAIRNSQAVIEFNKNGVVLDANKNFLDAMGYSIEEIKEKHHSMFCEKQYVASEEYKDFWRTLKEGEYHSGQFKRIDKYGNIKWLYAAYNPIYGIDGKVVRIIKFASDITTDKKQSLYYEGQIEAISKSQAVIEFDINGVVLGANNNFLSTVGYTLEDIVGKHHSMFCDKVFSGSKEYKKFWDDLKDGKYHSGRFKRINKNGEMLFIRATYNPIYGIDGKVSRVVKYAHDITSTERRNLFNEGKLEAISRSQAYIEFDLDGTILTANDNFLEAFKYDSLKEIVGKHHRMLCEEEYSETEQYKRRWRELVNGRYINGQFKRINKFGNVVWLQATYSSVYGLDGRISKIIKFAQDITAEKEQELYYQGQILAVNKSNAIIEFDVNGIVLNANENFLKVTDYKIEEIRGKHHSIFCDEKYVNSKAYKKFWKNLKEGKYEAGEYKRLNKNGDTVWLNASYNPIYGTDGEVIKVVKLALDITEEKEKSLYYQGQIDAIGMSQAVIEFDVEGNVIDANDNFLDAMGYHLDEILGKPHSIFCEEELVNSELYKEVWKDLSKGKYHGGQYKRIDKYGQIVWIQATYNPIKGVDGDVIKVIKFAHNITKDKELSLYYKGQIDAISRSQAVVEFDINGVVLEANSNFLKTFHYTLEEIKGKHHSMFCEQNFSSSDEYKKFWDRLKDGGYHSGQFKRINKEGEHVWIRATYNPIYGIDGSVIKIVKYAHDITEDQERSLYTKAQVDAINRAQAVIEFDMNGTILSANKRFLDALDYTLDEVRGKHHSMFCEEEYITSTKYHEFWEKLQSGFHDSGKYLRVGKNGKKVWIRATYTPVLNLENKPVRVLKYAQDITELETIKIDKLTGLYNNGKLMTDIREGDVNNLAIVASNEYDAISDFYGFVAGDTLIVQFSKILRKLVKKDFNLYRLHDDRFAILNNNLSKDDFEQEILSVIQKTNSVSIDARINNLNLTLTCGTAYGNSEEIVNYAKTAHNHAKNTKQSLVTYSKDLNIEEQFQNKIFWSKKIKTALKEDRFVVNYQAILNNKNGRIEKHEVLVRAMEKDQSLIYPNQFLNIAKTSKQYLDITKVVIEKAFRTFKDLPFDFSINMTIEDILDDDLHQFLFHNIKKYNIGNKLIVEIVESEQIKEYEPIVSFVRRLKSHGGKLAIDDFGSGYSNFKHVLELNTDFVKIDGSIVSQVCENNYSSEIIRSIVSFCSNMGIKTIAEFVSSEEILKKVIELGVDYSQGFFICKPQEKVMGIPQEVSK